ncbi:hypothetical protein, partial [Halorubrum sp. SP3]
PDGHVDIADAFDETTYPFVGLVPVGMTPLSGGLGNTEVVPTDVHTDNSGTFTGVEKTLRREFAVEVTPVTDDDAATRDRLTDAIQFGFSDRSDRDAVPDDITDFSVTSGSPGGRSESFTRSNAIEVTGVLHTSRDVDLPAAETVKWEITSEGSDVSSTTQ